MPTPLSISVRRATLADSTAIAQLVSVLGYATSTAQMRVRFERILADADYTTFVACDGEQIVGFIGARVGRLYESDRGYGHIMALAVAPEHQRLGVGGRLLAAAESALTSRDADVLIVNSGNHRVDAHAFYEKSGYVWTGRRYKKRVASSDA